MPRQAPKINGNSIADFSFLMLTFFLMTSSINSEQGIPRRLPPPSKKEDQEIVDINKRNVLTVLVNFKDELLVKNSAMDKVIPINQLKDVAKEFLANPNNSPILPMKKVTLIDNIGEYAVSQGVISLTNDQSTTYRMYVQVQNELQRAVNELRDQVSVNYFGKKYEKLDTALQKAVQKAIPMNISEAPPIDYNQQN